MQGTRAPRKSASPWERFWRHVDPNGPIPEARPELGPCWLWTGHPNSFGYGIFTVVFKPERIVAPPHRWLYEQVTGEPLPEGLEPDHLCFRRNCVNPAHIEPVTHRENVLRGTSFMAKKAAQEACVQREPVPRSVRWATVSPSNCGSPEGPRAAIGSSTVRPAGSCG